MALLLRSFSSSAAKTTATTTTMSRGLPPKIPLPGVKHVILVSSAKGGVGKSCTTVNLAFALRQVEPASSVGILDADLFGPSIPKMMNLQGQQPQVNQQNLILPLVNYGIKCMSMGFLVDPDQALVWRGLMVMQGIQKLLRGVKYGPLNYLLIDMPPGTGDTQLSLTQNIPITGAVIVTTPQAISLIDARKGITMFKKVNVNILGLMENMSYVQCEKCNHKNAIYGSSDGLSQLAADTETQVLARIPYDRKIMQSNEDGKPFLLQHPDSHVAQMYATTAKLLISRLGKPLDQPQ